MSKVKQSFIKTVRVLTKAGWLVVLLLPVGLFAFGCNQPTADSPDAKRTEALAVKAAGDCCEGSTGQPGGCTQCSVDQVAAKNSEGCGKCSLCAESNSAASKCGDGTEAVNVSEQPDEEKATHSAGPSNFAHDRDVFHFLLSNHDKIKREVIELENGVETLTESTDPEVVEKIQEHVASMYQRVENVQPIRMRDPLYREIFKHTDKIEMTLKKTDHGIRVTETSDDEYVVKLIQAHAKVVSGFAKRGFEEARLNHDPPRK